jgi:hypothetical protein
MPLSLKTSVGGLSTPLLLLCYVPLLIENSYAPTNQLEWINKLCPGLALFMVRPGDRRGLLDVEILQALACYSILRTDRNGWIELSTLGGRCGSNWRASCCSDK